MLDWFHTTGTIRNKVTVCYCAGHLKMCFTASVTYRLIEDQWCGIMEFSETIVRFNGFFNPCYGRGQFRLYNLIGIVSNMTGPNSVFNMAYSRHTTKYGLGPCFGFGLFAWFLFSFYCLRNQTSILISKVIDLDIGIKLKLIRISYSA